MTGTLALALDIGTSSARALIFDPEGRSLAGAKRPYGWRTTADGGMETEAGTIVAAAAAALDAVLADPPGPVAAVGLTSMWHTLVGVGEDGRPTTPVYSWSDMRARGAAAELRRQLDGGAVHRRTGAALHPCFLPVRLAWLRQAEPRLVERTRWWMSAGEYFALRLFGERRVSLSMASGTGLLDQNACAWDTEMLAVAGISADQLSPLARLDQPHRGLRDEWTARWPALARVPWLAALGDGACANAGSGCLGPDRVALSLGTSGALRVVVPAERIRIPDGLWCYRLDGERFVLGGAVSNGGNVYAWLRRTLAIADGDALEAALAGREPDQHGLTMLPWLAGERSPDWPLAATGLVAGLTLDSSPTDLVQAALEAVTYRLAVLRRLLAAEFPGARVIASGAALRASPAWARMVADVLGEPVTIVMEEEASARGAALLALAGIGALEDPAAVETRVARVVEPDAARHDRYAEALERHLDLARRTNG